MPMPSALEIARQATLKPVAGIAEDIGIPPWLIEPYGEFVAKIGLGAIEAQCFQDMQGARRVVGNHGFSQVEDGKTAFISQHGLN